MGLRRLSWMHLTLPDRSWGVTPLKGGCSAAHLQQCCLRTRSLWCHVREDLSTGGWCSRALIHDHLNILRAYASLQRQECLHWLQSGVSSEPVWSHNESVRALLHGGSSAKQLLAGKSIILWCWFKLRFVLVFKL